MLLVVALSVQRQNVSPVLTYSPQNMLRQNLYYNVNFTRDHYMTLYGIDRPNDHYITTHLGTYDVWCSQ